MLQASVDAVHLQTWQNMLALYTEGESTGTDPVSLLYPSPSSCTPGKEAQAMWLEQ